METIHWEVAMRRSSCVVGIALFVVTGCGSGGSKHADAQADTPTGAPDVAADHPASIADLPTTDAGSDAVPQPDATGQRDQSPASDLVSTSDLARLDLGGNPPDAGTDTLAKLDLTAPSDTASLPDTAKTDAAPDATNTTDATAGTLLGGCQILPSNHLFNTPIDTLPVHASSAAFISTIGNRKIHLDLGTSTDMASAEYYGIPFNVVNGNSMTWTRVSYSSTDPDMGWDPLSETDCVDQSSGAAHTIVSPCLASKAPKPWLPIPAAPLAHRRLRHLPVVGTLPLLSQHLWWLGHLWLRRLRPQLECSAARGLDLRRCRWLPHLAVASA